MILLSSGGCNIEGEEESWDFGTGAGFYVNATQEPWKTNYRMYSYVTEEVCTLALFQKKLNNDTLNIGSRTHRFHHISLVLSSHD